jgi:hypothetical protein
VSWAEPRRGLCEVEYLPGRDRPVNSFGELGATSDAVAAAARDHVEALKAYLAGLVTAAGHSAWLPEALLLLAEGAITTAAVRGDSAAAGHAREAARRLLDSDSPKTGGTAGDRVPR